MPSVAKRGGARERRQSSVLALGRSLIEGWQEAQSPPKKRHCRHTSSSRMHRASAASMIKSVEERDQEGDGMRGVAAEQHRELIKTPHVFDLSSLPSSPPRAGRASSPLHHLLCLPPHRCGACPSQDHTPHPGRPMSRPLWCVSTVLLKALVSFGSRRVVLFFLPFS